MVRSSLIPADAQTRDPMGRWRRMPGYKTEDSAAGKVVTPELAASVLPSAMLQQDELVLLQTKPSPLFIFVTSLRFILITVLTGILAINFFKLDPTSYITPQTAATLTAMTAFGRLIWGTLVWTSHNYFLTNQRILTIKGVLNVTIFQTNLRKIQRLELYRPLGERILGLGTLGFATAATTMFDSTWVMIPRPVETQEAVVAAINKSQGSGGL